MEHESLKQAFAKFKSSNQRPYDANTGKLQIWRVSFDDKTSITIKSHFGFTFSMMEACSEAGKEYGNIVKAELIET